MRRGLLAAALALAAGFAPAGPARADAGVRVRAEIQPTGPIATNTQVQLVISAEGGGSLDMDTPDLPPMTNLKVMSGPYSSRQTSMSMVNGSFTSKTSVTMTYVLAPLHPGAASVPAFDIRVGSTTYRTKALAFNVEKGTGAPSRRAGAAGPGGGAWSGNEDLGNAVTVASRLSASTAWVGETVLLETTLYTAVTIANVTTDDPAIPGAWVDTLQVDSQNEATRVMRGGRVNVAYPIARKVVVPTSAGTLTVPSTTVHVQVVRAPRDRFGMLFGLGSTVEVVRKTKPLTLRVRPLPEEGKPPGFGGAVGKFSMTVSEDRRHVDVGDAVAVRVTVQGRGSLEAVSPPTFPAPPDVKVYEPKVLASDATGAAHMGWKKTWEWVVVPLKPGTLDLPTVSLPYFDVETGRYATLHGNLPAVAVVRGAGEVDTQIARGAVQPSLRDIAFIKTLRGPLREPAPPLSRRPWFLALLVLPAVLAPIGIWAGRHRERLSTDRGFARGRRAARAAMKRLDRAARDATGPAYHEEIARALVDYVADRADRPAAGLTYDDLDAILTGKGVAPDLRRRFRVCLESCDFARFVPASKAAPDPTDLVAEARGIVRALEAAW